MEVFVVRVWPEGELRGRVEHVRSGEADAFEGASALLEFLGRHSYDGGWPGAHLGADLVPGLTEAEPEA
jgi:hypothetical protein